MVDQEGFNRAFGQVVANAWGDDEFKTKLLADPAETLRAGGVDLPAGKRVVILEDTDEISHMILPARPAELSDEELDSVAGGMCTTVCCGTAGGGFSL